MTDPLLEQQLQAARVTIEILLDQAQRLKSSRQNCLFTLAAIAKAPSLRTAMSRARRTLDAEENRG